MPLVLPSDKTQIGQVTGCHQTAPSDVLWTTVIYARAGYNSGNGTDFFELAQSGNNAAMLGLVDASNINDPGRFIFQVRNGQVVDPPLTVPEPTTMLLFTSLWSWHHRSCRN